MNAVKNIAVIAAVVFTIPLLALAVLYVRAGKLVAVRNDGAASIEVTQTITDGTYLEHTETKVLAPGTSTWLYFFPKIRGPLKLRCIGGGSYASISLGTDPSRFQFSKVVLDGCSRVVSRSGFAL
jgi:hypothetical protein